MNLTDAQREAVMSRGRPLLVSASAGAGKTHVLTQRVVELVSDETRPCDITELLVVTFTRAAAAELRTRIARELRKRAAVASVQRPRLLRQAALADVADIGTIDAWCGRLVRQHFDVAGVDPGFSVLSEEQAALLDSSTLNELFDWVSLANDELAREAREWTKRHSKASAEFLKELVLRLNQFRERLARPDAWFAQRLAEHSVTPEEALKRLNAAELAAELDDEARALEVIHGAGEIDRLAVILLKLEARYNDMLTEAKRRRGAYKFGDVLRMALELLGGTGERLAPTRIAGKIQARYQHVLIDEFQDTSPIQVALLDLAVRPGGAPFFVGDIKQSIYAFRDAEPKLFQERVRRFQENPELGQALILRDSFRTHRDLVSGLNLLFRRLFCEEFGGTEFGEREQLVARRTDDPNPRLDAAPRLQVVAVAPDKEDDTQSEVGQALTPAEAEAVEIARRIKELLEAGPIVPDDAGGLRPARLADFVVLLRAAQHAAPQMAAMLREAGVAAVASGRESMLNCIEVNDVRNVLTLLLNRRIDLPLAAYLRGPMVGLSEDDLLEIRRLKPKVPFHVAVLAYARRPPAGELGEKVASAFARLDYWRGLSRRLDVAALVRRITADTRLEHFALARPAGRHRVSMLRALESLAEQSEQDSLADFVATLDRLDEQKKIPGRTITLAGDEVRVMTIHAAKGLEFPFVFLAGAGGKRGAESGETLCCHEGFGLGLRFVDMPGRRRIATLAYYRADRARADREREEELRLLYVAATRAREAFFAIGHIEKTALEKLPVVEGEETLPIELRVRAKNALEWLLLAFGKQSRPEFGVSVEFIPAARIAPPPTAASASIERGEPADARWLACCVRLLQDQPDTAQSRTPAVVSVTRLKQGAGAFDKAPAPVTLARPRFARREAALSGVELGRAYHRALELVDFSRLGYPLEVQTELGRLVEAGRLPPEQASSVRAEDLVWFASTDEGRLLRAARWVRRELPFIFSLPSDGRGRSPMLRGVIDCVSEDESGLTVIDFKTDIPEQTPDWGERLAGYRGQLQAYGLVAGQLFKRPVARLSLVLIRVHRTERVPPGESLSHVLHELETCDRPIAMTPDDVA